ncbi:TrbI/VirB10 family protein [Hydrogenophaga sp.]|uniref:TrbI/VirB10 family protein n=1 Tax=Hydrogenophaga sp. TaxID=1904254 RepID=UPI0026098AAE|nr:TrbI/VirB10 family protein [Hydrogenophaga sp.]
MLLATGVILYMVFTSGGRKDEKAVALPEPELRPVPRTSPPPSPQPVEPVFKPVPVAAPAASAAVPPLPPGTVLPPVEPAVKATAVPQDSAARDTRRERRMAPLMVSGSDGAAASAPPSKDAGVASGAPLVAPMPVPAASMPAAEDPNAVVADSHPAVLEEARSALEMQILEGKMIPAVLETAIHTDLQGAARAMVDEDVYGETGRMVVIPRMSRLVGRYRKDVRPGQTRVLVMWQRVILPDGRSLKIMSPGTDGLGRSGMSGEVDNHFMERFGAAFLISMLGLAAETAADSASSDRNGSVVVWGSESRSQSLKGLNSTVEGVLKAQENVGPTIQIPQGSRVRILVARDLDLSKVALPR